MMPPYASSACLMARLVNTRIMSLRYSLDARISEIGLQSFIAATEASVITSSVSFFPMSAFSAFGAWMQLIATAPIVIFASA